MTTRQLMSRLWLVGVGFLGFEAFFCIFCLLDGMDQPTSLVCQYTWPHDPVDAVLGWARPVACPIGAWMNNH